MEHLKTFLIISSITIFIDNKFIESAPTTPPARGTVDFIKYAYNLNSSQPAYWSSPEDLVNFTIVDVDDATEDAIRKLVSGTWDKDLVGKGDDGRNLNQTAITVLNVKRIENPSLFSKYNAKRKEILLSRFSGVAPDVASLAGSRGGISTTQLLSQAMKDAVYAEVNEHYFFHGTKVQYVNSLALSGFIMSYAGLGQFGRGIYGAERSTKSDQYTDATGDVQNMLLVRMTLGNIYLVNDTEKRLAIRNASLPPDVDNNGQPANYNSVMSDFRDDVLGVFREFIIYNETQFYPEYIIEYKRMSGTNGGSSSSTVIFSLFNFIVPLVVLNLL
ncbi:tankyrase [Biomphalaria glabrata]|nr:tankyrase [Biomphalaria glabrata]